MHVGGYNEYIGGCSVHWGYHEYIRGISWAHWGMFSTSRDIMMHVGEQVHKSLSISIENPDVLNILRCTHDIPQCTEHLSMYSWYPRCTHGTPNVLMISPDVLNIPPMYSWYPPHVSWYPQCTEHPPMYSWYPSMYSWYPPDVLLVSPPMYSWYPSDVLNTHYTGWFSVWSLLLPWQQIYHLAFYLNVQNDFQAGWERPLTMKIVLSWVNWNGGVWTLPVDRRPIESFEFK